MSSSVRSLDSVPGWLDPLDEAVFSALLDWQSARGITGDLVELGVYEGRTAILLGGHLRSGERLVACDLFDLTRTDASLPQYVRDAYVDLSQERFEDNYRRFHEELPVVVRGASSTIGERVAPSTVRFVHIDASHRYEDVLVDADSARTMLLPDGIAVFDDYRNDLTPGTAAAVWEAVATTGLRPVCVTPTKFYGTWGDPAPAVAALEAALGGTRAWQVGRLALGASEYLRLAVPKRASAQRRTDADRRRSSTGVRRVIVRCGEWMVEFGHSMIRLGDREDLRRAVGRSLRLRIGGARRRLAARRRTR